MRMFSSVRACACACVCRLRILYTTTHTYTHTHALYNWPYMYALVAQRKTRQSRAWGLLSGARPNEHWRFAERGNYSSARAEFEEWPELLAELKIDLRGFWRVNNGRQSSTPPQQSEACTRSTVVTHSLCRCRRRDTCLLPLYGLPFTHFCIM